MEGSNDCDGQDQDEVQCGVLAPAQSLAWTKLAQVGENQLSTWSLSDGRCHPNTIYTSY